METEFNVKYMQVLIDKINYHKDLYYNKNRPEISDQEFDKLVDQLEVLEKKTGIVMSNSPTQTTGYIVKSELKKVEHPHPMLSLAKTKNITEFAKYCGNKPSLVSLKMDGLTVLITYENGELIRGETRGDGIQGEDITENVKSFENIPLTIPYKDHFEIEGEAIITYFDFKKINATLPEKEQYSNPRNLVSGSVRQLDANITAKRHVKFIAWKVPWLIPEGVVKNSNDFAEKLYFAKLLGFTIVPYFRVANDMPVSVCIEKLKTWAENYGYPYDGFVHTFLDVKYGESLGNTGHHPKHSFVLKEQDEEYETKLRDIIWQVGKSGQIIPVAIIKEIEIDGTKIRKASLSNLSIMKQTLGKPYIGQKIIISKRNSVIPKIERGQDENGKWINV